VNHAAVEPQLDQALFLERRDERERLVRRYLEAQGIEDPRVLGAMRRVPRHLFVPESHRDDAYLDRPLPIGKGQTISQPYIVALMTQAARITQQDRCLDIGTGSGYQAAILAELCASTYSIEYVPELAEFAKANLRKLGSAVHLRTGDGYRGWPEAAPFDTIIVAAAPEKVPQPLLDQLALGGRLVIPVGATGTVQRLTLWLRRELGSSNAAFERRTLADVRFVPFVGDGTR
jgi:protein-L-isoaspartate(D-aspartate) O-methyltransferase